MVVFEQSLEKSTQEQIAKANKGDDPRLGAMFCRVTPDKVSSESAELPIVLVGHPDDEGVTLNRGRRGSALAPKKIREILYKLTPGRRAHPPLFDLGDMLSNATTLKVRQSEVINELSKLHSKRARIVSLGGGHDHGYVDIAAWLKAQKKGRPLVINMDAHLDLRSASNGPHSGTPFFQLIEEFGNQFDLLEVGIQSFSSSLDHLAYAKSKKVKVCLFEDSYQKIDKIFRSVSTKRRPVFLSIDIDCFSSAFAPGCSAPTTIGLDPAEFFVAMKNLIKKLDVTGLGIYEVNPKFDIDDQTSRLAAQIIQGYIHHV